MFEIPKTKLFMDMVHGYVKIPHSFVLHIVDTELFQRLRNIDQTGMRILYPDAKHDRFGHSLGVFHLGSIAVDALLKNFHDKENYWKIRSDNTLDAFWAKNKVLFLVGCLLHDIGHAPFSHALEFELHKNSGADFDRTLTEKIEVLEKHKMSASESAKLVKASEHERVGAMLVIDRFRTAIKEILDSFVNYPEFKESMLFAEHYTTPPSINSEKLDDDIAFIVRMILGVKYTSFEPEMQIKNCFIDLLNGSNFDVDKLDYILRDTAMSGISNIGIDVKRLIGAINIVPLTEYKATKDMTRIQNFHKNTLLQKITPEKNGFIRMFGNITGTFSLFKDTKMTVSKGLMIVEMKATGEGYSEISVEGASYFEDLPNTEIILADKPYTTISTTDGSKAYLISGSEPGNKSCAIKNAKLQQTKDNKFKFTVSSGCYFIELCGTGEIQIEGVVKNVSSISLEDDGSIAELDIRGEGLSLTFLGDRLLDNIPTQTAFNSFSIGYHKQAINVISNVLDARDYLYLWIYAHHKVVYYANYLVPALATYLLQPQNKSGKKKPIHLCYNNIEDLDDAFVWTYIKEAKKSPALPPSVKLLINELLSRKYKKSILKSLAEFDILFGVFSLEEKQNIFRVLQNEIETEISVSSKNFKTAGKLSDTFVREICASIGVSEAEIGDLIWIDASYTRKKIDAESTYIIFSEVTTVMSKLRLLNASVQANAEIPYYFYLYYSNEKCPTETLGRIKRGIVQYFQSDAGKQKMEAAKSHGS